jgi:hypothetical protein
MQTNDHIKAKIAKALLSQHDQKKRNRQILVYVGALLALFFAHSYFSNMASPLKLIPQTMTAIGMGYVLLCILSLRRFAYVSEFIDWSKVKKSAEQGGPGQPPTRTQLE